MTACEGAKLNVVVWETLEVHAFTNIGYMTLIDDLTAFYGFDFVLWYLPANCSWEIDRIAMANAVQFRYALTMYEKDEALQKYNWFVTLPNTDNPNESYHQSLALQAMIQNTSITALALECDEGSDHSSLMLTSRNALSMVSGAASVQEVEFHNDVINRDADMCVFCDKTDDIRAVHMLQWHQMFTNEDDIAPVGFNDVHNGLSLCVTCEGWLLKGHVNIECTDNGCELVVRTNRLSNKTFALTRSHKQKPQQQKHPSASPPWQELEGHHVRTPTDPELLKQWPPVALWAFRAAAQELEPHEFNRNDLLLLQAAMCSCTCNMFVMWWWLRGEEPNVDTSAARPWRWTCWSWATSAYYAAPRILPEEPNPH